MKFPTLAEALPLGISFTEYSEHNDTHVTMIKVDVGIILMFWYDDQTITFTQNNDLYQYL